METVKQLIKLSLAEDIGSGDITTDYLIPPDQEGHGSIVAKEDLLVAGLEVAGQVFAVLDPGLRFDPAKADGDIVVAGEEVVRVKGRLASILKGERTALNFLQRLSGIATHVRRFMDELGDQKARLVDTRKTTPGWRVLEKYAVRVGGAANHRMGLYDGILIKDNHIAACGGIAAAVARARHHVSHLIKIEVEAATLDEVEEALSAGADVIMLDNMNLDQIRTAVQRIAGKALVEASGGVGMEDLRQLAATGVDLISVGALTHGATSVDLSMRF
jgi:nicotinate-nucleotide pyrophosphorylase (carboxylating)